MRHLYGLWAFSAKLLFHRFELFVLFLMLFDVTIVEDVLFLKQLLLLFVLLNLRGDQFTLLLQFLLFFQLGNQLIRLFVDYLAFEPLLLILLHSFLNNKSLRFFNFALNFLILFLPKLFFPFVHFELFLLLLPFLLVHFNFLQMQLFYQWLRLLLSLNVIRNVYFFMILTLL